MSHTSTGTGGDSSGMSSPAPLEERNQPPSTAPQAEEPYTMPEDDDILKMTTGVVKSVKELSDRIHKSKPSDYVDLVKVRAPSMYCIAGKKSGPKFSFWALFTALAHRYYFVLSQIAIPLVIRTQNFNRPPFFQQASEGSGC